MVFPSKKDAWLVKLVLLAGGVVLVLQVAGPGAADVAEWLILLAMYGLIAWVFLSTAYEITATDLLVRSGPFRWTIPLNRIDEVCLPQNPLSSLALSLDQLEIRYRRANGKTASLMISPRDKSEFVRQLAQAVPGLRADGDRAARLTSTTQDTTP